jgi:heme O synthase-like polyprenyltransferase
VTAVDPRPRAVAGAGASVRAPRRSLRQTVGAYVALTKPRIIELLLVTTVPTMVLAEDGLPPLGWCSRRSSAAPSPPAAPTP